jgi:hypothetical protein
MTLDDLRDNINEAVDNFISELKSIEQDQRTHEGMGLDPRALYNGWYNDDCLVILARNRRTLDYYGGFEYIEEEHVSCFGDYVIYSGEHSRVSEVLDHLSRSEVAEEECEEA